MKGVTGPTPVLDGVHRAPPVPAMERGAGLCRRHHTRQHQLLLAIRGHDDVRGPTIGDVAEYLLLRHHSVVGLVDRAEAAGLVRRRPDAEDHRTLRLVLTRRSARTLEALASIHARELERLVLWGGSGQ
jgi:DNA-binding MarR family transcriptional regulator